MRKIISAVLVIVISIHPRAQAQTLKQKFTKANELTVIGEIIPSSNKYQRVDSILFPAMPSGVKKLLTHAAGKAISFTTNSKTISAKWCVTSSKPYPNLTAIANKGLDLYIKKNGHWQYAGVGRPDSLCSEAMIAANMDDGEKECLLYLPIYDAISNLEIGVDQNASIQPASNPFKKRIVIYGSSIVQGAAASRPGMAYPAILSRLSGYEFLNLGLSGSAKMEPAVISMVNDVEADAYVLDCIPNSSDAIIRERAVNMIYAIHDKHPGKPLILVNTISREQGFTDNKVGAMVEAQNRTIDSIAHELLQKKLKDFYFIDTKGFLGEDHEGSTDGVHPNDLGFYRFVEKMRPLLMNILSKYFK